MILQGLRLYRFALSILLGFSAVGEALAAENAGKPALFAQAAPRLHEITVSPELGYIVEVHPPETPQPAPRIVVYLQETHTNYGGQKHLAAILEQLMQRFRLRTVMVEGGSGDVSLSYLRAYGPPANRLEIAEKYLRQGLIGGEEYLNISSDYPMTLWGIEDSGLYQTNLRLFLEAGALRPLLSRSLDKVQEAVDALKPVIFSPVLSELHAKAAAFAGQQILLGDYAEYLTQLAESEKVATESYPDLLRLAQSRKEERAVKRELVPQEQVHLIGQLEKSISADAFGQLIEEARAVKAGLLSQESFYLQLGRLIALAKPDMAAYPNLASYLRYLQAMSSVDAVAVSKQLKTLLELLQERLVRNNQEKTLSELAEQVRLVQGLIGLDLSPADYAQAADASVKGFAAYWPIALNELFAAQGLPARSFEGLDRLNAALPLLHQFYAVTQARDRTLAQNVIDRFAGSDEAVAALITGGFHGQQITRRLREAGLGVVVIVPRITQATDKKLYEAVLKYKSGAATKAEWEAAVDSGGAIQ